MAWRWKWQLQDCNKLKDFIYFLCFFVGVHGIAGTPAFEKKVILLKNETIKVEIADTEEKQARGLMFRKPVPPENGLPPGTGMLFEFNDEQIRSFWMKNTLIDLSIGFFDKNKTLVDVQEMKTISITEVGVPTYQSSKPAKYALEMNKGWFEKNKIKVGDSFRFKDQK